MGKGKLQCGKGSQPVQCCLSPPPPRVQSGWRSLARVSPKLGLRKEKGWAGGAGRDRGGGDGRQQLQEMAYRITFVFLVILLKVTPHLQIA